ncbi:GMC oxidoreductase [Prochlorococcus marinus]|uniref:GMC oxidoreductase n=1 Tax=Prochlorococcus marinus XMU1408 TaxID=2213228 RepID=A0A318R4N5_PROMR|nr:GMC family oxidoreductase [Prochlorococcus marinus]MBW3041677.1 GMC oxidoreductase [Prochlorococcus marinus str. XMU1408]PYE02828.1 GMC oxidoreductase [Prochlorococcus marinus XMU1408]
MIDKPYEVIIIGSGATGGMAALTMAKAGVRVLVVERGPELEIKQANGTAACNMIRRLTGIANGKYQSQTQHPGFWKSNPLLYADKKSNPYTYPQKSPFMWTQGNQVGGRSLTWGGITLRLCNEDFEVSKEKEYSLKWPINYKDLESHYTEIERFLKVYGNRDELEQLPCGEYIGSIPFTESEKQFASNIKEKLNLPFIHSRGFGPNEDKTKWPKFSSLGSTLKEAISLGKVEILSNHVADKLVLNKDRKSAKSVIVINQTTGERSELDSKLIILCSSTIQTLRFLLSSEEKNSSNGLIDPSQSLGMNLMDHISTCRFFTVPVERNSKKLSDKKDHQRLSGAGSFFIPIGRNRSIKNNFVGGYGIWGGIDRFEPPEFLKRSKNTKMGFLIGHGEVLPNKKNKVTLSTETDRNGVSIPHISVAWRENEKNMVIEMNRVIELIINSGNGTTLPIDEILNIPFVKRILDKSVAIKNDAPPPGYYIHEVGGAPMGNNKEKSVVDNWNRLWECGNVLVVDGACWPTSSWQSPTLTMMAITKRACEKAIINFKG